jgi:hypothetical protein
MKDLSKNLGVPHFFNVDKQYKTTKGHIVPGGQKEQANGFKKYFEEKAHPTDNAKPTVDVSKPDPNLLYESENEHPGRLITPKAGIQEGKLDLLNIANAVLSMGNGKAADHNGLYAEAIKLSSRSEVEKLKQFKQLFDIVYDTNVSPSSWDLSIIIPIKKGGKPDGQHDNYREISLVETITKIYSLAWLDRLLRHLNYGETCWPRS